MKTATARVQGDHLDDPWEMALRQRIAALMVAVGRVAEALMMRGIYP